MGVARGELLRSCVTESLQGSTWALIAGANNASGYVRASAPVGNHFHQNATSWIDRHSRNGAWPLWLSMAGLLLRPEKVHIALYPACQAGEPEGRVAEILDYAPPGELEVLHPGK